MKVTSAEGWDKITDFLSRDVFKVIKSLVTSSTILLLQC